MQGALKFLSKLHVHVYNNCSAIAAWAWQLFGWKYTDLGMQLTYKPRSYRAIYCLATSSMYNIPYCDYSIRVLNIAILLTLTFCGYK